MMKLVVVQLNFEIKFPNLYVGIKCSEPGQALVWLRMECIASMVSLSNDGFDCIDVMVERGGNRNVINIIIRRGQSWQCVCVCGWDE